MSERRERATCPVCGGRAPLNLPRVSPNTVVERVGAHKVVGLAGHGGRCSGTGQSPVPGSVR